MNSRDHTSLHTPIGWLKVAGDTLGVEEISFSESDPGKSKHVPECLLEAASQLKGYFEGDRQAFDLPLRPAGTEFQLQVWNALSGIPFGQTRSYKDVAIAIQRRDAVRAVGAANGQNRLAVVLPCHRVVGADGSLTGYAGELWRKEWLLKHERETVYGKQGTLF